VWLGVGFGVGVGNGNVCGDEGCREVCLAQVIRVCCARVGSAFAIMVSVFVVEAVGGTDSDSNICCRSLSGVWSRFFFGSVGLGDEQDGGCSV
jgi:hypothetical protein